MIELDTKGFQEMIDALDNMGKDGETIFKRALDEGIKIVQKAIQRHTPVYKGPAKKGVEPGLLKANILIGKVRRLADGVYSQVVGPTKGDISKVFYGKFLEYGWKSLKKGETVASRHRVNAKARKMQSIEYGSSEIHAQPFMRPGFDESKDEAYAKVEKIIMDGIEQSYKK